MRRRINVASTGSGDSSKNQVASGSESQDKESDIYLGSQVSEKQSVVTNNQPVNSELASDKKKANVIQNFHYESEMGEKVESTHDLEFNNTIVDYSSKNENKKKSKNTTQYSETDPARGVQDFHQKFHKICLIRQALEEDKLEILFEAAVKKSGLIDDEIRRKVWPKLAGVDVYETSPRPEGKVIETHHYYSQVVLDVNRSLKRFPPSIEEKQRMAMQDQLVLLIMRILVKHPDLHYYQGYHDICVTFLLVLGEEIAFNVVEKLSTTHLRVFMDRTMERTNEVLECIYPLIRRVNPVLQDFLIKSDVGVIFSLSWVITWYGHVLSNYSDVVRLFDLFLASHPWMPLYLAAAIVLHRESEILEQDCDMACVHSVLSNISDDLPFENLIEKALDLFHTYSPQQLKAEQEIIAKQRKLREMDMIRRRMKLRQVQQKGVVLGTISALCSSVTEHLSTKWTVPITMAAAVVFYAVFYQIYNVNK